jgi:hypothetical protein
VPTFYKLFFFVFDDSAKQGRVFFLGKELRIITVLTLAKKKLYGALFGVTTLNVNKTFCGRNLRMFVIGWSVCPLQVFSALFNVCK